MDQPAENTQLIGARLEDSAHSSDSSLREQALGHVFLGQLLTFMWRNGARDIEVLKSEVDRGGYDVVLESNGIIRHVQLKSSFRGSKVREVDVSTKLLRKPGGCILWLEFDRESLAIERYYWFGSKAGNALPDLGERISRHSKGNSEGEKNERPIHRVLTRGRFEALASIGLVVENVLLGPVTRPQFSARIQPGILPCSWIGSARQSALQPASDQSCRRILLHSPQAERCCSWQRNPFAQRHCNSSE
jgi:hypothetical protein